jgi:hypothetical protein
MGEKKVSLVGDDHELARLAEQRPADGARHELSGAADVLDE